MKIIVYNSKDQYALSRRQIETIKDILPNEYFTPIHEFHITHNLRGAERFEYFKENKQAHFFFPVEQKSTVIINEAVTELLLGLARIKSNTNWGYPLSQSERDNGLGFIEKWFEKCIEAIT